MFISSELLHGCSCQSVLQMNKNNTHARHLQSSTARIILTFCNFWVRSVLKGSKSFATSYPSCTTSF